MNSKSILYVVLVIVLLWFVISFARGGNLEAPEDAIIQTGESESDPDTLNNVGENNDMNEEGDNTTSSSDDEEEEEIVYGGVNKGVRVGEANINSIRVHDQTAGVITTLTEVNVTDSSWVVVYEDRNGGLGNILGAQRFDQGNYSGGKVELLRGTTRGNTYHVLIHPDNGDRIFDHKVDVPLANGPRRSFTAL